MNISQQSNPGIPLERSLGMPPGGPKCIPLTLDFSAATSYSVDYTNMQQRNFFDMVQSVFVDNSLSNQILTITVGAFGQVTKVPAGVQGYFPLLVPNPIKLDIACSDPVLCQVILINFPVPGFTWK